MNNVNDHLFDFTSTVKGLLTLEFITVFNMKVDLFEIKPQLSKLLCSIHVQGGAVELKIQSKSYCFWEALTKLLLRLMAKIQRIKRMEFKGDVVFGELSMESYVEILINKVRRESGPLDLQLGKAA